MKVNNQKMMMKIKVSEPVIKTIKIPAVKEILVKSILNTHMRVDVRVDAFPFTRFGDIKGSIKSIAEESKTISQNDPNFYYETIISLDKQYIEKNNKKYFLKAGESISANIILEERPVIFVFSDIFETTWDKIKTIKSSN